MDSQNDWPISGFATPDRDAGPSPLRSGIPAIVFLTIPRRMYAISTRLVNQETSPESSVLYLIAAGISGRVATCFFKALSSRQFAHYMTLYKKDIIWLRVFVPLLVAATTLKSMQGIGTTWVQNVKYFSDVASSIGYFSTSPLLKYNLLFVALIAFYVQMFFCHRLWVISKNIYILGVLVLLFLFALLTALLSVVIAPPTAQDTVRQSPWVAVHLGTVFAGDFLLCSSMSYFLLTRSKQALPQTAGMLNAILKLTFQSAAPAAICAMVNLICNVMSNRGPTTATPWTLIAITANELLPKLYAISALWTLNSRRTIRVAASRSNGQNTSSEGRSGGRRMELGVFSGRITAPIQVRTEVETVHHQDAEDLKVFGRDSRPDDMGEDMARKV
ncbi:hypothetical protein MSAN_00890100 [Mycena sanguinolenta]|uniref:DUF6534 domain-containing protein n=1 Tax=Mycena sanguinolenta TaxID=230812 RepID=A0A8H6YWR5_9AGAR|nr:hypothetical protein MSAN_00890100 [Mycena sanguinolenta]